MERHDLTGLSRRRCLRSFPYQLDWPADFERLAKVGLLRAALGQRAARRSHRLNRRARPGARMSSFR